MKKLFLLDDRTGLFSTTKLLRWLTWFITVLSIINLQAIIYLNWVDITGEDVNMLMIVERLLMAILVAGESSYQVNRGMKLKNGKMALVEEEKHERIEI